MLETRASKEISNLLTSVATISIRGRCAERPFADNTIKSFEERSEIRIKENRISMCAPLSPFTTTFPVAAPNLESADSHFLRSLDGTVVTTFR